MSAPIYDDAEPSIGRLQAELASTKRQLDDARRELDAFGYSVSHDLRAPLRALNGFSRLLSEEARDVLTGDTADYLARIVGATRRLELLLEDLLTLSRAGRAPMQIQSLDIGVLAREIAAGLDASAPERQVEWRIADFRMQADPTLLHSALEHLLGNAFKFTRTRERASIELLADQSTPDASGTISGFSVRDNGVGFDMSFADRLFAPFQRLHPASAYEGNGIGLALIQRIIRRHDGRVWLESSPEQGTQAYVRLWESGQPPVTT